MLITILTIGTRGDIQPYVALGLELKKAGQRVRIATLKNFEAFVTGFGLEFYPVQGDVSGMMNSDVAREAMQADNPLKFLRSFNQMKSYVFELQKDFFEACQGADAVVYHPGAAIGYFVAQQLGIPSILATPFPMAPTRAFPSLIFYDMPRLGPGFNFLTHKILEQIMWMSSSAPTGNFWKKKFGKVPGNFRSPYSLQTSRNAPTVISCSPSVFPRPKDWPEQVHMSGYWFLEEDAGWQPPAALLDFLERGAPPVYIGFGSIGDPDQAEQTTRLMVEAVKRSGQRGILATGWVGMSKMDHLPDEIYVLESAPHSWLFPRMSAVVHHGGAGATAAGLRAGVPTVVIPHGNDQFAWGRRVYELGVGAKPIPRKKLTAEKLAEAIRFALTSEVRAAAKSLGSRIQAENGSEIAAKVILSTLDTART